MDNKRLKAQRVEESIKHTCIKSLQHRLDCCQVVLEPAQGVRMAISKQSRTNLKKSNIIHNAKMNEIKIWNLLNRILKSIQNPSFTLKIQRLKML